MMIDVSAGVSPSPAIPGAPSAPAGPALVNDIHSQTNTVEVREVLAIRSVADLQAAVRRAARDGHRVSICGGRHAMGGQQFGAGTLLLDTSAMSRVVDFDVERGLITVEAGIEWPALVNHLLWAGAGHARPWGIIQKQTGADRLSIGGALSANIHGRGMHHGPIIGDVESFELVDAGGGLVHCSRSLNATLFALVIGGYGLFGAIARVTLRLAPRVKMQRHVVIARADDLPRLFEERVAAGFDFGDFQFATDPGSREFLQTGVFSCYRKLDDDRPIPESQRALTIGDWRRLLLLAHTDKSRAFAEYARHYISTDGQLYWSDTHQLADYVDHYHDALDRQLSAPVKGTEMISELYVPRHELPAFLAAVRADARRHGTDIIYGTVRLIERDDESVLAWAREPWACIIFNLHVNHSPEGLAKAASDFGRLIDTAIEFGGSYYLTYHRWARADQVERCHPRMREFLALKKRLDPEERFTSDWYEHHVRLLAGASQGEQQ